MQDPSKFVGINPTNVHDPRDQLKEEEDEQAASPITDPKDLPIF